MAKDQDDAENDGEEEEEEGGKRKRDEPTARSKELSQLARYDETLTKLAYDVEKGFEDQNKRLVQQLDWWDIYDCVLNNNQAYNGNAQIYVPLVHDAVNARVTRFTNQIFPQSGRYVEVVTSDGDIPHAHVALGESYVRKTKLRTEIIPALLRNGDIEGQYNLYVSWSSLQRHVAWREMIELEANIDGVETPVPGEMVEDIVEDVIFDDCPKVEVIPDADVLVLPAIADSIEEALSMGGSVSIARRWSKAKVEAMIKAGEFDKASGEDLLACMDDISSGRRDVKKEHVSAAGIKGKGKWVLGRETWHMLKVDGGLRLCRSYFTVSDRTKLGTKRCPFWCDLVPIISCSVEKVSGSFKGKSKVQPIESLQYFANDIMCQAADSATYAMMPIVMTDPLKNPKTSTMILDLAAVWEVDPNSTKFAAFPELWKQGFEIVGAVKAQIFQTLGVNPAMIPQSSGSRGGKRNQAETATEQQVDILTTADAVSMLEEGVLNPLLRRFFEYDAQFRSEDTTIRAYGMLGQRAKMEVIKPLQMGSRFDFRWLGVEAARNAQQIQQQIAAMNVIRGIPPQLMPGRRLDLTPIIEQLCENAYGPRLAPLVLIDLTKQIGIDPEEENDMLADGFDIPVMATDDDVAHVASHRAMLGNDKAGTARIHIVKHMQQMEMKAAAMAVQQGQKPGGQPGAPGGAGPGMPGQPRQGAQPAGPRPQGPPGMIPQDNMPAAGAVAMPRKM